jgi:hypothetical protein
LFSLGFEVAMGNYILCSDLESANFRADELVTEESVEENNKNNFIMNTFSAKSHEIANFQPENLNEFHQILF